QDLAQRIEICDLYPDIGVDGLESLHDFQPSYGSFERRSLSAGSLPRRAALKTQRVKQLAQRLKFPGAGRMPDGGDAFDHSSTSSSVWIHRAPHCSHFHAFLGTGTGNATA